MSKIKLGQRPATFKPFAVKFPMPDGTEGVIEATFHYRTRTEFGKLLNIMYAVAGKEAPKDGGEAKPVDFEALFKDAHGKNSEHLLSSLAAWSLDEELNAANLAALCDELPAAAAALASAYQVACQEGRLGN